MCSVGTEGEKWGDSEKAAWLEQHSVVKRHYEEEVLVKLEALKGTFDVEQIGTLSYDDKYKLYVATTRNCDYSKPFVLVTGGVHGYETSGVQGALRFLETKAMQYSDKYNIIVAPCVSPWGYETINRWTQKAVDPNRSFSDASTEESAAITNYLTKRKEANPSFAILAHFDLHETTNSDATTFRPALLSRDGKPASELNTHIPDGFYLVSDANRPVPDFQQAIIQEVTKVTHIAPADSTGHLIGQKVDPHGVIQVPGKDLGLCMGLTEAQYVTTTEVYPDSPSTTDEICTVAQVAVVTAGLDYLLSK